MFRNILTVRHDHFHHDERTAEEVRHVNRRLGAVLKTLEKMMATLDELNAALGAISAEVDKVSADTDNLLAQLAAIPPGGLTPEQQAAIDSAVASATSIADRLKAIDDKVPDATA